MSSVENNILQNMYYNNSIDTSKSSRISFITMDKDYRIDLYRESFINLYSPNKSCNYKCHIVFYDNYMGNELLHLILSEVDIFYLLFNFHNFYYDGAYDIPFGSGYHSTGNITNEYSILMSRQFQANPVDEDEISYMYIDEYNTIMQTNIHKLKIKFSEDSIIDFLDKLFFQFLIDIITFPEYNHYYKMIYDYYNEY